MDVSVIIPTYKPGDYIDTCLKSLAKQTLGAEKFEIIIVLNGCSEPWLTQLKESMAKYLPTHNVQLIHTNTPGVSNARNMALDIAKGDFITFIDDDDYISATYLEQLLSVSSPKCVGLSDAIYVDDTTLELNYNNPQHNDYVKLKDKNVPTLFEARRFFNGPVMKLLHRSIIGNYRFDRRFAIGEDSLFMAQLSHRIGQCRFACEDAIYYRRVRANSATTCNRSLGERIGNSCRSIGQYCRYWFRHPVSYSALFMTSRILASVKNLLT